MRFFHPTLSHHLDTCLHICFSLKRKEWGRNERVGGMMLERIQVKREDDKMGEGMMLGTMGSPAAVTGELSQ